MSEPVRPDPDALLADAHSGRGRLKVFLGMSPGVGKTFEMLRDGGQLAREGREVLVGVVETHGRRDTEALLAGLEVMARKPLDYKGRVLMEFDLDEALARKPGLLLVDEYAHTNAPGSRHPKRWQDVEELLAAGLDVWTTLNVQHLESLVDVVWKITGVRQRETVPDSALSKADDIEVVDITPAELRQRLTDGKVYVPETARTASENFFRIENLTALRELALRRAAQTVDGQLMGAMRRAGVEGPWAAGERILVMVGGDGVAQALVRAGRRLADMMMDAPWTVAHVDRPGRGAPSALAAQRLNEALKLAEQLGAVTVTLTGDDVVGAVTDHARRNNVTQIVIGKGRDSAWRAMFGRSLAAAMLKRSEGAALHVVTDVSAPQAAREPRPPRTATWTADLPGYGLGVAFVAAASGVAWLLNGIFEPRDLDMVFMASVLATAVLYGLRPAIAAATVAFLVYNFLFLQPRFSFTIGSPRDLFTLVVFWVVALVTGGLAGRVRDQQRGALRRASAVGSLLSASRRLSGAAVKEEAARALAEQISAATGGRAQVLLPLGEELAVSAAAPEETPLSTTDMAAVRWAWEKGEAAGAGTGTLPNAGWTAWPLQGVKSRSGVVVIESQPGQGGGEDERFVLALLDQGAVALERAEFAAQAADADALRKADRLRSALLNSISHDLRTPLSTVLGAATTIIDYGKKIDPKVQRDLLVSIREEAERLNRYVGDLLDMTRLEGGALVTRRDWIDLRDVLTSACARVEGRLGTRRVERDFPRDLTQVKADPGLLEQAVVNILENAIAYSGEGSLIEMAVYEDLKNVVISIEDEGRGIPTAELERVFDRFRRMEESSDRGKGAGLGLAIAKGFVEAMGGRIAAASPIHDGRGTRILISMPKDTHTPQHLL